MGRSTCAISAQPRIQEQFVIWICAASPHISKLQLFLNFLDRILMLVPGMGVSVVELFLCGRAQTGNFHIEM